jgi:ABC-type Fe3+ transport system permease subunit/DNA-binding beta-propeller fold protein YncE
MNWPLFQNSMLVAGSSAALATLIGFAFALFAAALRPALRRLAIALAVVALVLPPFLITNTWLQYFGLAGLWKSYLNFNLYSLTGTVLLVTLSLWPVAFLLILGSIIRIQPLYLEQEPRLRAGRLLKYILWPSCRGAIAYSLALTFVLALNNFSIPVLLQTKVYTEEVWLAFSTRFDYATALRLSWPLILAPILILALLRFRPAKLHFRAANFPHRLYRERLAGFFPFSASVALVITAVSVFFPLYQLLASARTWTEFLPAISAGRNALANSLLFALGASVLLIVAGQLLRNVRSTFWTWIAFLAPGVLLGIALIYLFNRPPLTAFYQSVGIVLVAYLIRFLALAWTTARVAHSAIDRSLTDTVSLLGANRWQQFRLAEWPQSKWMLLGGAYLLYLLCLWEVETLLLIVPPGRETLALRVFNMLHYGHAGQVDALCVWLLIVALAPLALYAAATHLKRLLISTAALLLVTGCTPSSEHALHIRSKLFTGVEVIGTRGTGAGQFNKPRALAVDRDDNLYVVDLTGRIQKFSPLGQYLLSWQMPETDIGKPKGMIKDCDGNVIVIEPHYSRLNHFDPQGKLLAQWGENGTNISKLQFPRAAAINSRGEIYVSEYGLVERIQRFAHHGTNFIQAFGSPGTAIGQLNRAEGLGIGPDDRLYVADSCNHRVQIFSRDGQFLSAFGRPGSAPGELSYPYDVRIDAEGNRFVCEFGNSRVQIFDAEGRTIEILGGAGAEPGEMNNPWSIALDSRGNLYVADSANHRVQKFTRREPLALAKKSGRKSDELLAARTK